MVATREPWARAALALDVPGGADATVLGYVVRAIISVLDPKYPAKLRAAINTEAQLLISTLDVAARDLIMSPDGESEDAEFIIAVLRRFGDRSAVGDG